MRMTMYWLVQGCHRGDSLLFHYSGHCLQQRNKCDEADGYDETLCSLYFQTQGMIVGDEINITNVELWLVDKAVLPMGNSVGRRRLGSKQLQIPFWSQGYTDGFGSGKTGLGIPYL